MESRDGEWSSTNLIAITLQDITNKWQDLVLTKTSLYHLLSCEGVGLAGQPIDPIAVQTAGQAAVGGAAHLHCHIANTLHHATGEAAPCMGCYGLHPLSWHQEERGQEEREKDEHLHKMNKNEQ